MNTSIYKTSNNMKRNKKLRPSFLTGLRHISQVADVKNLQDFFWNIWLKGPNKQDDFVLAYVLCRAIDEGSPKVLIEKQLCHTRQVDIQKNYSPIRFTHWMTKPVSLTLHIA